MIRLALILCLPILGCNGPAVTVADRLPAANIGPIGLYFNRHFRNITLRPDAPTTEIETYDLATSALDKQIRKELPANHVISINQFLALIEAQKDGQAGPLLTNGYANIAYIEDENGTVWAVFTHFSVMLGNWFVEAYSVDRPSGWSAGSRVIFGT
jgi:hypothetical protein